MADKDEASITVPLEEYYWVVGLTNATIEEKLKSIKETLPNNIIDTAKPFTKFTPEAELKIYETIYDICYKEKI